MSARETSEIWTVETRGEVIQFASDARSMLTVFLRASLDSGGRDDLTQDRQAASQVILAQLREALDRYSRRREAPIDGWQPLFQAAGLVASLEDAFWNTMSDATLPPLGDADVCACVRAGIALLDRAVNELNEARCDFTLVSGGLQ